MGVLGWGGEPWKILNKKIFYDEKNSLYGKPLSPWGVWIVAQIEKKA